MTQLQHYTESPYFGAICQLSLKNQRLILHCLDYGLVEQAKELQRVDDHLLWLLRKSTKFDFVGQLAKGKTLLIGEGNLSFALSLARKQRINPANLTATTFERASEIAPETKANAEKLRLLGVTVLHGVDAADIADTFSGRRFEAIAYQFPHVGSREPVEGQNPNFILIRDFLESAAHLLTQSGVVLISAVDSPHYRGAFQFQEAAEEAGFAEPASYPFEPDDFPGYVHSMTHQSGSALDNHDDFSTWIFRLE
ncbi:MAG: class I SAM-dependent methyltransferase [Alphaproteobacteria bacterium]